MRRLNYYPRRVYSLLLASLFFLSACSSTPQKPNFQQTIPQYILEEGWHEHESALFELADWKLIGKLGIRSPQKNGSARLDWQQQGKIYQIHFIDPLGRNALQLLGNSGYATVRLPNKKPYSTGEPEKLLLNQIGWEMPITEMPYWVLGAPAPDSTSTYELNNDGRLAKLNQAGWQIIFDGYQKIDSLWLPKKINMTRNDVKLKLIINQWTIPGGSIALPLMPISKQPANTAHY